MNLFLSLFFLISVWINFSSLIYRYFEEFFKNNSAIKKQIYLILSLGFILSFSSIASFNILLHMFGITFSNNYLLIPITITFFIFNISTLRNFSHAISLDIKKFKKIFQYKVDPFISIIILIILVQVFCLFIRFLLPVTHTDALSQYFYDSLQISRLENLSISDYYALGESFRTDSLASFFDAFIIQLTDSWFLVRSIRVIALLLVVINSLEIASYIGSISLRRGILLSAVILTLPDVWDIALSGKHDVYVFLFELVGIYAISFSVISKDKLIKIIYLATAIFIGFMSIGIRLSSITFIFICTILLIYNLKFSDSSLFLKNFIIVLKSIKIPFKLLLLFTLISNLTICIFNIKYFSNPFYKLSPPEFLESFFPNAIYSLDYKLVKESLSLKNIPFPIKPIATIFYSIFGIEPIRYLLNKFKDLNYFISIIFNYVDAIGPKAMMVSILSFSPFTLLPYFGFKYLNKQKKLILVLITLWILLWSISIPYTRVALASSIALTIFGFSQPNNFKFNLQKNRYKDLFKATIISMGLIYLTLFSFWSLSYLPDLPLNSLFNFQNYNRSTLTRDYLNLQNKILNKDLNTNLVPSEIFELKWREIEEENKDKLLFLNGAPKRFGYFMNKGLITSKKIKISKELEKKSICFDLQSNQLINRNSC